MNQISELEKERRLSMWKKNVVQEVEDRGKSIETLRLCRLQPHRVVGEIFLKYTDGTTMYFRGILSNTPIIYFKYIVSIKKGVPVCFQRLVYGGKQLEDDRTVESYSIPRESTLFLLIRLAGC